MTSASNQRPWFCLQGWLATFVFSPLFGLLLGLVFFFDMGRDRGETALRRPLTQASIIFALGLILTCLLAEFPGEAALGLAHFLPFILLLVSLGELIGTSGHLRRMATWVVFSSLPVAIIGLGQRFWGWSGPIRWLGIVIDWPLTAGGIPPGRISSIFGYANDLAAYLVVVSILALGLLLEKRPKKRWFWIGLGVTTVLDGITLFLTHSRNAWAIAALAVLAYALYWGWRMLVAAVMAVCGLILWSAFGIDPSRQWVRMVVPAYIWARLTDEMFPDRPLAQLRSTQWQFAIDLMHQRPLVGWGLRSFSPLYETQMNYWIGHPHNLPLMFLAEMGIPLTIWFFCLVTWILAKATHLLSRLPHQTEGAILFSYLLAFAGISLFHLLDITLFDSRINFLGWWLLGSILGLVYSTGYRE
ncbi:MAG: O-antigen ligase family protein [Roseofilum sp. SBFL]|uniref:O-antigen ligase family protein n=1 Tax=unclassified Roseofilum TaxID=2620099 RepID=UPI001B176DD9|nr:MULTISPECIES: O-antigen ligase family protein [unclassified Roseofilum]MBP0012587.1 O-antigen ligase family protein [Roseofilum sp. SID3]MBP0023445.1 O-antigen ligase family protein [Roseofilum sp. SID2]MBP0038339.1 O-antigen ligase family protein [Roseofilum sp. SID1]MBP0043845.1 O-antigen ligase family protein [Roseofilum sp. SBFL]